MNIQQFESRKKDHLDLALQSQHQIESGPGLERIHLYHESLPEFDFSEVRLSENSFGQELATPFFIAGMTAGHPQADQINLLLAQACGARGWAFGVGSQRREVESEFNEVSWPAIRKTAPDLLLIANLGISQVISLSSQQVQLLLDRMEANALAIHLNALQEVLQPEGTPRFRGGLEAIRRMSAELTVPVLVKETGCGFSNRTLASLKSSGIYAIDVSGYGGTHWGRIEGTRAHRQDPEGNLQSRTATTFKNWGENTLDSVIRAKAQCGELEIWASGGVRSGLDCAKLIALGATRVGFAQPALKALMQGLESGQASVTLHQWMEQIEFELKTALFCTSSLTPQHLRKKEEAFRLMNA